MLGWFQALMPKEEAFFDLFEQHAGIVVAGAEALRDLLKGGDHVEKHRERIFVLENEADEVARPAYRTAVGSVRAAVQDREGRTDPAAASTG